MEASEVHFLAKSAKGGSIELSMNGKRAAFWSGDTRLYEPTPMFELDNNAKREEKSSKRFVSQSIQISQCRLNRLDQLSKKSDSKYTNDRRHQLVLLLA